MQCLVCTGEAKDITPAGFDGIVVDVPIAGTIRWRTPLCEGFKPRLYQNAVRPTERPRAFKPQHGRRSPRPASNSN